MQLINYFNKTEFYREIKRKTLFTFGLCHDNYPNGSWSSPRILEKWVCPFTYYYVARLIHVLFGKCTINAILTFFQASFFIPQTSKKCIITFWLVILIRFSQGSLFVGLEAQGPWVTPYTYTCASKTKHTRTNTKKTCMNKNMHHTHT